MSDMSCPWCECSLELSVDESIEQHCPECLTSWTYQETEVDLPLAA